MKCFAAVVAMLLMLCSGLSSAALADDARPEPPLYGLYCWAGSYVKYADDVQKLGIRSLRAGGWDRKDDADRAALLAARNGVTLQPALSIGDLSHKKTLPLDEGVEKYRTAVREAVARYGPGGSLWRENPDVKPLPIRYWQIWNEPNIEFLNPEGCGLLRTELYAKLLKAASEEIRKLDPGACIIAFNTAGGCPYAGRGVPPDGMWEKLKYIGWRKFIKDVNAEVGPKAYDGVGTHPYTMPAGPEGRVDKGVEMIREFFKEQNFKKDIWFTEVGYPIEYPNNLQVRDERQQACFTARLYAVSGAHGATQVQIMFIEDITYSPDGTQRSFGFFTAPGKWRQQATATQVMIRLVPDPRKNVKILSEESGGVWAYQFEGADGKPVVMAWNAGEGEVERELAVPASPCVQVDMLGKVSPAADAGKAGGTIKVTLSEAPIYLVPGDVKTVEERLRK